MQRILLSRHKSVNRTSPQLCTCLRGDERVESDDVDAEVEEGVDEDGGGAAAVARRGGAHQQRLEERRVRHADQEDGVQRQRNHRVQLRGEKEWARP